MCGCMPHFRCSPRANPSRVAHTVGYATPSAFLAAFRRTVGTSPGRCLNGDAAFEASAGSAAEPGSAAPAPSPGAPAGPP